MIYYALNCFKISKGKVHVFQLNVHNLKMMRDNNVGSSESYIDCYRQDVTGKIWGILDLAPGVIFTPQDLEMPKYIEIS